MEEILSGTEAVARLFEELREAIETTYDDDITRDRHHVLSLLNLAKGNLDFLVAL